MTLTDDHITAIRSQLEKEGVASPLLRDDLVDHLCCDIELKMEQGESFAHALSKSIDELAPYGLYAIQKETIDLLTHKMTHMKKMTYLTGLISSMMMAGGTLLTILHLPGGGTLASPSVGTLGFILFVATFLPMFVYTKFKSEQLASYEKYRLMAGMLSGLFTAIGVMFKIFHWPGANVMILTGASLFTFAFLPFLFFSMYKKATA